MIKLNRLTRGLQTQKFLFYLPIVYCRLQIRKASHQIEIHCFLKPSVLMENFAKTHQRFVVPDIPMFSPTETVLSIKEKSKFEFKESPIFSVGRMGIPCFLSSHCWWGCHLACLKVKANPVPLSPKSEWIFIFYLFKHQSSMICIFLVQYYKF